MKAWAEASWRRALQKPGLGWLLLLRPLAALLGLLWRFHAWRKEQRAPQRVPGLRVLSVGNLSVGGTGKTPLTLLLLEKLAPMGRLAVLSRGYGSAPGIRPLLVSQGHGPLVGPAQSGDEPQLLARRSKRVKVLIDPDRVRGARHAQAQGADTLILDDGFQRRWDLARDLDILLLDYQELRGRRQLFPAGPWREPLAAAQAADLILISRAPQEAGVSELRQWLPAALRHKPLFRLDLKPVNLFDAASAKRLPLSRLRGTGIAAFSGIARPDDFEGVLQGLGAKLQASLRLGDHGPVGARQLQRLAWLAPRAQAWVCTEKDWARLDPSLRPQKPVWVLGLRAQVSPAPEFWRRVKAALRFKRQR